MDYLLRLFFSAICLSIALTAGGVQYSDGVLVTSLMIQFFNVWCIFSYTNLPYSLNKIFHLFSLLFFGIAPLLQFQHNIRLWGWDALSEQTYITSNITILLILIVYQFIYFISFARKSHNYTESNINVRHFSISSQKGWMLIALSSISFLSVFYARDFNIGALLFRGGEFGVYIIENQSKMLIIENFLRPLSIVCFLFYLIGVKEKKFIVSLILFLLGLFTCFPTGMPRFAAAALYIPVVICTIPLLRKRNVFQIGFLFGFLFIFPFLSIFRYFTSESEIQFSMFDSEMFLTGDYDSYYNFSIIISNDIVTYGKQLLGVILFWVPRSFWPTKPIGSGAYVAEKLGFSFSNISANYFAEGFINFGIPGIILFVIILALVTAHLDCKNFFSQNNSVFFKVSYLLSLGLLFFILRGDLLSSIAYTTGYITSAFLTSRLVKTEK